MLYYIKNFFDYLYSIINFKRKTTSDYDQNIVFHDNNNVVINEQDDSDSGLAE